MPRIKKRQVIVSSDADEPKTPQKSKASIEAAFARGGSNTPGSRKVGNVIKNSSAQNSPASKKGYSLPLSQSNSPASKNVKTRPIHSFFNSTTQKQQSRPNDADEKPDLPLDLEEDGIQDSSDESSEKKPVINANSRKRKIDAVESSKLGNGSRKFLKSSFSTPSLSTEPSQFAEEHLQWTDEYRPQDLEELAVHKRKVQDVREWLNRVISGTDRKRLLVLKGGAGAGKTTTLRLLCQQLGINITEWHNPDSTRGVEGTVSLAAQFEDFVRRASSFGNLSFTNSNHDESDIQERLLLVEEFPNTYSKSSSTLQGFRRAVLQYLAAATPSMDEFFGNKIQKPKIVPMVMIISESLLTTSTASADSFTAHRLLGPEILSHPGTTAFEFNPIAPTFMAKALDLVLKKDARKTGRRFAPGSTVLKHLSETGDVRSAISALQFFCIYQGDEDDWSGKIVLTKGKNSDSADVPTAMERQTLEMVTQRENTLGIFHAVGKVVYNKREPADTSIPQPLASLPHLHRPNKSEVDAESLLNELGTEIHIFVSALHENYALSCNALEEDETLDAVNGCIDSLSDADLLFPSRYGINYHRFTSQPTATDSLRQDDIGFFISVLGILFSLPFPVKRLTPPTEYVAGRGRSMSKNTAFQMMYPTSERIWRQREQIQDLLVMFKEKFRNGELTLAVTSRKPSKQGVDSWQTQSSQASTSPDDEPISLVRSIGMSELLLERLPYVAKLEKPKGFMVRNSSSQQLQKIVGFGGLGNVLSPEEEEVADDDIEEQWSTDKPTEENQPWRKSVGLMAKTKDGIAMKEMEKLILSDDDIEDD